MRKAILLNFLVTFVIGLSAQNKLTNREVFAFDSGDVIHSQTWHSTGPSYYLKRYFLSGNLARIGSDTLEYEIVDSNLVFNINSPSYYDLIVNSKHISFNELDSIATKLQYLYKHRDTTNVILCNDTLNVAEYCDWSLTDTTWRDQGSCITIYCFKGLGKFVMYGGAGGGPWEQDYFKINYYKKSNRECGKRLTIGIKETQQDLPSVFIYPNPVRNTLYINGIYHGNYLLYSFCGQIISKGIILPSIQLEDLESGIYFLEIENENQKKLLKFIKD